MVTVHFKMQWPFAHSAEKTEKRGCLSVPRDGGGEKRPCEQICERTAIQVLENKCAQSLLGKGEPRKGTYLAGWHFQ